MYSNTLYSARCLNSNFFPSFCLFPSFFTSTFFFSFSIVLFCFVLRKEDEGSKRYLCLKVFWDTQEIIITILVSQTPKGENEDRKENTIFPFEETHSSRKLLIFSIGDELFCTAYRSGSLWHCITLFYFIWFNINSSHNLTLHADGSIYS